jgi:hypothetical protein
MSPKTISKRDELDNLSQTELKKLKTKYTNELSSLQQKFYLLGTRPKGEMPAQFTQRIKYKAETKAKRDEIKLSLLPMIERRLKSKSGVNENVLSFDSFSRLYESSQTLAIKKNRFNENSYEYSWIMDGKEVGEMMVFTEDKNASIVGFFKHDGKDVPRGYGYRFIKMCIDDLLKSGFNVYQADHTSNENSQNVWKKLSKEYKVETTTWRGDPAKVIRKK